MSEHDVQSAFMSRVHDMERDIPELRWLHAIPNGGDRNIVVATKLKAEGVRKGIWDIFWPYPCEPYLGLYIEFKFGYNKLTPEQVEFGEFVRSQGYCANVAYTVDAAVAILRAYLGMALIDDSGA